MPDEKLSQRMRDYDALLLSSQYVHWIAEVEALEARVERSCSLRAATVLPLCRIATSIVLLEGAMGICFQESPKTGGGDDRSTRTEQRAMKRKPTEPTEAQIEQYFTELLELDGWRALRTDPVQRREWGKGFGEIGMADHLYIRYREHPQDHAVAEVLWVEFKARGGKPSEKQLAWHTLERKRGALTIIVGINCPASCEGLFAWYKASGLMRRGIR